MMVLRERIESMLKWLWLSGTVVVFDQVTKVAADGLLRLYEARPVVPSFNLTLMYNRGAAFSFLSQASGWQRWFFILLAAVISVVLVLWLRRLEPEQRWTAAGISLILGGAVGNLIDRILYGHVIDFIQVYYAQWYWPAFNVADSAISVGVAILLIDMLRQHPEPSAS